MNVWIEGRPQALAPGSTVEHLLQQLGHEPQAVAVAINGQFVPRHARAQRELQPGDKVDCFKPIVGG